MIRNIFQNILLRVIKIARKYFRNTWVHRLPFTSKIYKAVFRAMYTEEEKEITFHNMKLYVPTKDTSMVPSIMNGDYEALELAIFRELLQKGDNVLDIGANLGIYSVTAAKIVGNGGQVHAFEPVPENVKYLRRNIKLNNIKNVKVAPIALSDKKGFADIYIAERNVGTHSMGKYGAAKKSKRIETDTLENYIKAHKLKFQVAKMDVEGFEGHVFRGAKSSLDTCIVLTEFTAARLEACGDSPIDIAKMLLKKYRYCYIINERDKSLELCRDSSKIAQLNNSNLLLSPKKISLKLQD